MSVSFPSRRPRIVSNEGRDSAIKDLTRKRTDIAKITATFEEEGASFCLGF